ncbi:hypothetical protein BO79DRAFT_244785 [Aspergillus costaricaensis CBS 115574]|uniref:Uncharacterized protein n=1 Tax=Aspergillus costaricaensis CBS 115574 TaxID=1448317 RepID=A0ACD1IJD6_9EURO|nr:hypothetical protein BO79DRAFT_244785 [Aspergillus costaricaensis CBS 115574]RAK89903.1 hypothetical protein BO79DRAFT_244785 [Aspergillus costaricaensis CBS 115574]
MGLPLPPHIKIRTPPRRSVRRPDATAATAAATSRRGARRPLPTAATAAAPPHRGPTQVQLERSKIIDALEDAGIEVPEGVLPPTRELTESQKLRKKELREEIARLKEREREHNEALRVKTEQWDTARKGLVDAVERHDSERAESFAPDYQLSKELDEQIKSAVAEIKGLEHNIFFTRFTACI